MKIYCTSQIILLLGTALYSSSFCPEEEYLHRNAQAGYSCYKDDVVLCDSNLDPLCDKNNCLVQFGGFENYTCSFAEHYEETYMSDHEDKNDLIEIWKDKCCYDDIEAPDRRAHV